MTGPQRTGWLEAPGVLTRLEQLRPASDRVWLLGLATGVALTLVAAFLFPYPGSPSGKFWAYASLLIRGGLYLGAADLLRNRGGEILFRLFALGMVAGTLELLVDWGLIHWVPTGRLVYLTGNDVVLLGSPVWMPLAWACVIVEIGYPALRLFGRWRRRFRTLRAAAASSVLCASGAGVTVGFYEFLAYRAGWWKYEPARAMLGEFCALYIPLGEFLMFLAILPVAARAVGEEERRVAAALAGGARFAVAIAAGYALAYLVLELR
ncbi:MAG TPA: hypothetical protein VFO18_13025 [Methylomirabilota bacterium]|nr:hypothetical protein [Methylomirabilota bacterium]